MAKYSRSVKADKSYEPVGRSKRYEGIYVGFVKSNTDIQKMGRLKVWIPEFGSQEDDANGWFTVSYASPFAGATSPKILGNNQQTNEGTQTSYGFWAVPPDLDNQVLVMFVNADPTRGVALGCLFQQFMNKMVPGMPADKSFQFPQTDVPVAEYNKRTNQSVKDDIIRPAQTTTADGINSQGLIRDTVRGVTSSGARRAAPSEVYGLLTPGPINPDAPGKRLGGSQFYMDDGAGSEHIRIRTKTGAQLLIDETNGLVYAINKAGTSWMQMDAEGNFDVFAAKSVSIRSQEDINYRADRDFNIEAGRNINIKAAKDYLGALGTGAVAPGPGLGIEGGNIIVQALGDIETTATTGMSNTVLLGNLNTFITGNRTATVTGSESLSVGQSATIQTAGAFDLNSAASITASTAGAFSVGSNNFKLNASGGLQANGNIVAGGIAFAKDFKTSSISLSGLQNHTHIIASGSSAGKTRAYIGNGGSSSVGGAVAGTASLATISELPPTNVKANVLATFIPPLNDTRLQQPVITVVGRFITFEPCPEHINKG